MEKGTSWNEVADWYDAHLAQENTYHRQVILPNLLRLIAPAAGKKILDLACGQGFFTRAMRDAGALATGTDIAPNLIARAEKESKGIAYTVAQSHALPYPDGNFEIVTCVLALQNIEKVLETLRACARVLAPNGRLILVMNHPAFRVPQKSAWGWDEEKKMQYRRVDAYLSESRAEILIHPGKKENQKTLTFHRPLQWYLKALRAAGFTLTDLEEWISHRASVSGPRAREENRARKEFPLFLMLACTKVSKR